jgi:hypothetical protein
MVQAYKYRGFARLFKFEDDEAEKDFARVRLIAPRLTADIEDAVKQIRAGRNKSAGKHD